MERETKFNILRGIIVGSCLENEQKKELIDFVTEYEDAEENGLLKHLPCRVGDTVYCLMSARTKVVESKVLWIEIHQNGVIVFSLDGGLGDVVLAHLGKKWFLTMEAAEQALAKMKGV